MKTCVAIVGKSGAGKETVYQVIKNELEGLYLVSIHHFSDPLGELLDILAQEKSTKNKQKISTLVRKEEPEGFGEEVLGNVLKVRALGNPADIVVLDGVRRPQDVVMLRGLPNNFLVLVEAPLRARWERIRHRADRPGDAEKTWETFLSEQSAEAESKIDEVAQGADIILDNSVDVVGGGLSKFEHLRLQVRKFLIEKVGLNIKE